MRRLRKYRLVSTQTYDLLCVTTIAFDVINKRLTRLIQPTQKAARLITTLCVRENEVKMLKENINNGVYPANLAV